LITQDSEFFRFTFHILPWITYVVFVIGMVLVIAKWSSGAPSEQAKEGKSSIWGTIKSFVLNLIVQKRMLRKNPNSIALWVISWILFHIALFAILFGHLRGFHVWYASWFGWLASEHFLVKTLPYYVGFILLAGVVLLLLRRVALAAPRAISTFSNYIVLLLLLVTIVAGIMMRIIAHTTGAVDITIPPGYHLYLEDTPSLTWLTIHAFFGQIVFMYIPFSGLIHIVGTFITTIASSLGEHSHKRNAKGNVEIAKELQ
jgi:[DsrC]-trisulfide reductase subunit M